jgi:hypothetical protein
MLTTAISKLAQSRNAIGRLDDRSNMSKWIGKSVRGKMTFRGTDGGRRKYGRIQRTKEENDEQRERN